MPITFETNNKLSLLDIVRLFIQRFMVLETPHIGNLSMSSLVLMFLGLKPNLVDVNIGTKDNLFYPHEMIKGGTKTVIAPAEVMTTHNKVTGTEMSLCEFHTAPLKELGFNAECHSQMIANRADEIHQILKAVYVGHYQLLWGRFVDDNGLAERQPNFGKSALDRVHKLNVPANGSGWVIPNPINILIDAVLGAKDSGKDVVYMLSGQSMYKYITKNYAHYGPMSRLISELYDLVVASGFSGIPKKLQVHMVPIPVIRHFAVPSSQKDFLDEKLEYLHKTQAARTRCGIRYAQEMLSKEIKNYLTDKRGKYLRTVADRVSYFSAQSESGMFYTQHDLAADKESVYIPDNVMELPIYKMMVMVENLQKFSFSKESA